MRLGDSAYLQIRERAEEGWLAIVPTGSTEQQGPLLPVDLDTWLAKFALAAPERAVSEYGVNSLVLPTMPFGPTPEHRDFRCGYIHIPAVLHDALVASLLGSLAEQGLQRIVVWRGCGQLSSWLWRSS
jgi:creatinine amidohydrolase